MSGARRSEADFCVPHTHSINNVCVHLANLYYVMSPEETLFIRLYSRWTPAHISLHELNVHGIIALYRFEAFNMIILYDLFHLIANCLTFVFSHTILP